MLAKGAAMGCRGRGNTALLRMIGRVREVNAPSMLCCCFLFFSSFVLPGISPGSALEFSFHAFCFLVEQWRLACPGLRQHPWPKRRHSDTYHVCTSTYVPCRWVQTRYKPAISPPSAPNTDGFCHSFLGRSCGSPSIRPATRVLLLVDMATAVTHMPQPRRTLSTHRKSSTCYI